MMTIMSGFWPPLLQHGLENLLNLERSGDVESDVIPVFSGVIFGEQVEL